MSGIKTHYNFFLESGDIYEMNENATGEWDTDKKWFRVLYKSTLEGVNNIEVDYEE